MTDLLDTSLVLAALSFAAFVVGLVAVVRSWGRAVSHGGHVDRAAWEMYAAERLWDYTPDPRNPKLRGVYDEVATEVSCRIVSRRTRRGKQEYGTTSLRMTHRADLPPRFLAQERRLGNTLAALVSGARPISVHDDLDPFFHVESADVEATRALFQDDDLRKAMLRLSVDLPEAVVDGRAISATLPGMVSNTNTLDMYLDLMAGVAKALYALSPRAVSTSSQDGTPALAPLPSIADLPRKPERLGSALGRLGGAATKTSASVQVSALRLRPYEYEVEVRSINPGVSRAGIENGGRMLRGLLVNSQWKIELLCEREDNEAVDALQERDVVGGMCLVDDLRGMAHVVECTAQGAPILLKRGAPPPQL